MRNFLLMLAACAGPALAGGSNYGIVWYTGNGTIGRLGRATGKIVDAQGRFWYMGSHSGKLGVIE